MGEKKKKEASRKTWSKIIAIVAGVLFVVLMVVSSMGSSWITSFATVKPGDTVVVDYTLYDSAGNAFMTTDQQQYKQAVANGRGMIYTRQLTLAANQSISRPYYPVQIYTTNSGWGQQFALFASEFDAISSGVIGMKTSEKRRIAFPDNESLSQFWSGEALQRNNVNLSALSVGESLAMGVSDNPQASTNASAVTYIRIGQVTQVTPEGVQVNFGYPAADITVTSINKR